MLLKLKIQIKGISKPPIWRRVLVPDHFTFSRLHSVIQEAFGWYDCHLYQFSPNGYGSKPQIGIEDEWSSEDLENAEKVQLKQHLHHKGQKFTYIYDFGDDWIHSILVEQVIDQQAVRAELLQGRGKCPPEDCGGPWGYESLKEILEDPKHPQYEEMREWMGINPNEIWDSNDFDLLSAKIAVAVV
jgi:hypothetical protein